MEIVRTGIILNTENYGSCVNFYKTLFGFEVLFEEISGDFQLTCFDFFGAYLMIETGGTARSEGRSIDDSPVKIRINVADIDQALVKIKTYGIEAQIQKSSWGTTINIHDPDGNRVGIRDEKTFARQMN